LFHIHRYLSPVAAGGTVLPFTAGDPKPKSTQRKA
jgi:hypothetical protein